MQNVPLYGGASLPGAKEALLVDNDVVGDGSPLRHVRVGEGARGLEHDAAEGPAESQGQLDAPRRAGCLQAHIKSLRPAPMFAPRKTREPMHPQRSHVPEPQVQEREGETYCKTTELGSIPLLLPE